jgi:hypothetical protein
VMIIHHLQSARYPTHENYLHLQSSTITIQMGVIFTNHCTVTAQLKGPPEGFEEVHIS